jgi:hypothetical protein
MPTSEAVRLSDERSSKVVEKAHLAATIESSSEKSAVPQGLKLLIWYVFRIRGFVVQFETPWYSLAGPSQSWTILILISTISTHAFGFNVLWINQWLARLQEREHNVPSSRKSSGSSIAVQADSTSRAAASLPRQRLGNRQRIIWILEN